MTTSTLSNNLRNENIHSQKDFRMDIYRSFIRNRQKSKWPKYLSIVGQWINQLRHSRTMQHYSAMERNQPLKHTKRIMLKSLGRVREAWHKTRHIAWLHLHKILEQEWIHSDKKEVNVGLGMTARLYYKGVQEKFGVMEMLCILTGVIITWV